MANENVRKIHGPKICANFIASKVLALSIEIVEWMDETSPLLQSTEYHEYRHHHPNWLSSHTEICDCLQRNYNGFMTMRWALARWQKATK